MHPQNKNNWVQSNSTTDKVFAFYMTNRGLIIGITYDFPVPAGVILEHKARGQLWSPKQIIKPNQSKEKIPKKWFDLHIS